MNKITLTIIVNGETATVEANVNAPLRTVVNKALADTQNTGQPSERWELRDKDGNIFDLDKKVNEFDLVDGTILYLSLEAGHAG